MLPLGSGLCYQREYIYKASHALSGLQRTKKCYALAKYIVADSLKDLSIWKKKDSVYHEEACIEAEKARVALPETHSLQLP